MKISSPIGWGMTTFKSSIWFSCSTNWWSINNCICRSSNSSSLNLKGLSNSCTQMSQTYSKYILRDSSKTIRQAIKLISSWIARALLSRAEAMSRARWRQTGTTAWAAQLLQILMSRTRRSNRTIWVSMLRRPMTKSQISNWQTKRMPTQLSKSYLRNL